MDIKEKPKTKGDSPKSRAAPVIDPKQAAKLLRDKYVKELEQRPESESVDAQAAEQVQDAGTWAVDEIVSRPIPRQKKQTVKEKPAAPHREADRPAGELPSFPKRAIREMEPSEGRSATPEPRQAVPKSAEPANRPTSVTVSRQCPAPIGPQDRSLTGQAPIKERGESISAGIDRGINTTGKAELGNPSTSTPTAKRQAVSVSPRDRSQNGRPIIKERGETVISTRQATAGSDPKTTSVLLRKGRFPHAQGQQGNKLHSAPLQ